MTTIIRVALPVPLASLFDYQLGKQPCPVIGARVRVPFGSRQLIGIVVEHADSSQLPLVDIKPLLAVLDQQSLFGQPLWKLLHWAAAYYQYPLGEVLQTALPLALRQGKSPSEKACLHWKLTSLGHTLLQCSRYQRRAPKQYAALKQLSQEIELIPYITTVRQSLLHTLQAKGLVQVTQLMSAISGNHFPIMQTQQPLPILNDEQHTAVTSIGECLNGFAVWLLQGVTGSGKTEVYLRLIAQVLAQGKQALLLLPEISLTHQTISRLQQRFGITVAVHHSGLSDHERLILWMAARQAEIFLVIGTRSALFTPFPHLGIIIVDEEHDRSYKQQNGWRYHARDLAILRAHNEKIPILLGSATPALESLHNVHQGKYRPLWLTQRASGAAAIKQLMIDLRGEPLTAGMAPELITSIQQHLQAGNQVLLFLNRRGYAPVLLCHDCGWIAACLRCDCAYTLHHHPKQLCCHHCGKQDGIMSQCATCGSTHLITLGIGTEQLELALQGLFPSFPIQRIDRDSTRRRGALAQQLSAIHQGGARLLIGTQMLAKGHHFPDVTLVALLDIDAALFSSDYRASERLAQLYTQVAGRAGRASKPGQVILQTYHPQHPLLQTLLCQGYEAFSKQLLAERRSALLPPYISHALFLAEALQSQQAIDFLTTVRQQFEQTIPPGSALRLLGPAPSLPSKRADYFRWQLLLEHPSRQQLQQLLQHHYLMISTLPLARKVKWALDVDPIEG